MRGFKLAAVMVFGIAMIAFAVALPLQSTSADDGAAEKNAKLSTVVYRLSDLPAYTKDGDFSYKMVLSFVEQTVEPKTWEGAGGPSTMAPYPQNLSVVITTTDKTHDAVKVALEKLRN